jgi:short-subunit dehydrogenase
MNRSIVVTGATSGIGKAFAEFFASQGDSLILISRNEEKLRELCGKFEKANPLQHYRYITADLSKPEQVKKVMLP